MVWWAWALFHQKPFFFLYQTVFKRIKLRLPLTGFERALVTEINVAPAQLHPNSWAFIRTFSILCNHFTHPPPSMCSSTSSRPRAPGRIFGWALVVWQGEFSLRSSNNLTRASKGSSLGCVALSTTLLYWTGSPFTRWRNSSLRNPRPWRSWPLPTAKCARFSQVCGRCSTRSS